MAGSQKHNKDFFAVTILLYFVSFLMIFLCLGFFLIQFYYPGSKSLLVQSGSMSPTIKTGDLIIVQPKSVYSRGDIITFYNSDKQKVTHRIVLVKKENNKTTYITRGDANKVNDETPIFQNQVIGKVYTIIPYVGHIAAFSKTTPGIIILIIIPATIIIYDELKKLFGNISKHVSY